MKFKKSALAIIAAALSSALAPAEAITPAEWAAKHVIVPDGPYAGARADWEQTPYIVEPLNCCADASPVNRLSIQKSVQTGASFMIMCAIAYAIDREPARMMVVQPTDAALTEFSREKLQPLIEACAPVAKKVRPQTSRSSAGSTTYSKKFPGGSLTLAIASSPTDLRSKTIKRAFRDEASAYPRDLDGQGSPHEMIAGRYTSFLGAGDWKDIAVSTPTIKGECQITAEFEASDRRYWHMPCPGCGDLFVYKRSGLMFGREAPFRAHYITPCCGSVIEQAQKNAVMRTGKWIATAPGRHHRGYHIDALMSPFVPFDSIAEQIVAAEGDEARQKALDTLVFGEPYEVKGDAPDHIRLMALREPYPRRRIPAAGLLLVAAADVQANAIYVVVSAIASDRQSWVVEALVLDGDTSDPDAGAFAKLHEVYETKWPDEFGGARQVDAFGVDSGFRSNVVYNWCRSRARSFSLKGGDGWTRAPISSPSLVDVDVRGRKVRQGAAVWTVGTWSLKAQIFSDLRKLRLAEGGEVEPAGACHHGDWLDENYFLQLTSEYLFDKPRRGGGFQRVWKERRANHYLDCEVYCRALADYLGASRMTADEWRQLARLRGAPDEVKRPDLFAAPSVKLAAAVAPPAAAPAPRQLAAPERPRSRQSSWL